MSEKFREQLSTLMDGELPKDELRFLLRRVQADGELAQSWSRYQITSAILRRQVVLPLRADFVQTVMIGVGTSSRRPVATFVRWMGGGAIAAAVAVVALIETKPADVGGPVPASSQVAAIPAPAQQIRQDSAQAPAGVLPNLDFALPASYETPWVPVPRYDARFRNENGTGDVSSGLIPYRVARIPELAPAAPAQPAAAQHQ